VRRLAVEADKIAKSSGNGHLRGAKRQVAALEVIREEVGYHHSWGQWSATAEEMGDLVDAILRHPALSIYDLAVKFDALAWLLLADGAVVDHEAERQVRSFARALRKLATAKGKLAS